MSRRLMRFFAVMLLTAAAASSAVMWRGTAGAAAAAPVSVIVELKDDPGALYKAKAEKAGRKVTEDDLQAYRSSLTAKQDQFLAALGSRGVSYTAETVSIPDFTGRTAATFPVRFSLVYNGVTMSVPSSAIATIKAMPQVKAVHYNGVHRLALDQSVKYINAPKAYGKVEELTPFDDLREGYEGQGINIAVLDTGMDWSHEMFGGDATPPRLGIAPPNGNFNKKIIYYLTFTGGLPDGFGHGTHSSADAAGYLGFAPGADGLPGTADDKRVHGVAPQARLMGYKVCADVGSCVNSSTILAIEDAVSPRTLNNLQKPVANVINMSLGGAGTPDDPEAVASDNATLMGTIVVASAGNDGPAEGTVGAPSVGRRVISVGANTDPGGGVNTADVVDGSRTGMKAMLLQGAAPVDSDLVNNYVYCGLAETIDQVPDSVSGRIALIARGSTVNTPELPAVGSLGTGLFQTKTYNAVAKGAAAVIFINNDPDPDAELSTATVRKATIPVLGMSRRNGEYLVSIIGSDTQGAVSAKKLRVNAAKIFSADMADFSSRGPVAGYGQIKPDVTAPGVDILSATVRVGGPEANTATMFDPTGYVAASGTSFSGPHVTGASAIIKQAHLDWTPDMVRTALINTATNLRAADGTPKTDGSADSINAQGGGLVDVWHAVNAKALMGVAGDGIVEPSILGSHSFGEVPVINSRTTHTESVPVTIHDVSGQQRTYNLSLANNRDTQRAGISTSLGQTSVTVPAYGDATFTVGATVDGDLIRSLPEPIQMQWYVTASSADGESLRMPFYLKPVMSVPANQVGSVETLTGTVTAGDGALQLAPGVTYVDVPFEVKQDTFKVDGRLDFPQIVAGVFHDLDLSLLDPDGNEIAKSANAGGPEFVSVRVSRPGTYTYRVIGFANAQTDFIITSTQLTGGSSEPATLGTIPGEFRDAQNRAVDFDGAFSLYWGATTGSERGFEVERSADNGQNWQVIASVPAGTTTIALNAQPDGALQYRLRSLYPGQIGTYVSDPSNVQSVLIDHRTLVDITSAVQTAMSNVTFAGSIFQLDLTMTNKAAESYVPYVELRVVRISSTSGTVTAANADNGGAGSAASPAAYNYSNQLGSDQEFTPGETSAARSLRFNDPRAEMFSFDVQVTAYRRASGASGGSTSAIAPASQNGTTSAQLPGVTSLLRFTANPLTKSVSLVK
ncbi:MAG: minor extracellular serine protease Vpr [Acidobacteriota bacterium]|nr:minor extracellular serine protease Vpr [Acidobacteriota bacterium]